jgi:hypothetical protein
MEDNGNYGRSLVSYMESKHISWVWWVSDPLWRPAMLKSWKTFEPAVREINQPMDLVSLKE